MIYRTRKEIINEFRKPKNLSEKVYKARMYANVFGGPILASIGTIAVTRYIMFPKCASPAWEAYFWVGATICSLPLQLFTVPAGLGLGVISRMQLAESRAEKRKKLEEKLADSEDLNARPEN